MRGISRIFLITLVLTLFIGGCVTKKNPQISILNPKNEDIVSGTVNIEAQVTVDEKNSISSVEFYVDDTKIGTKTQAPYTCSWNTEGFETGNHTITVKAYDNKGNTSSASINVGKNAFLKWIIGTGYIYACPAIGDDGTIYVIGSKLYAINPDGSIKWGKSLENEYFNVQCSPVIGNDGTIYVVSSGDNAQLYAVNLGDGSIKWSTLISKLNNHIGNISLTLDSKGNIYIGNAAGYLYSLDSKGNIRWTYTCGQGITSYPVVDKDDNIYTFCKNTGSGGVFYSINSDGNYRWSYSFPINEWCTAPPSIDSEGNIYLPISSGTYGKIYKYDKEGTLQWTTQVSGNIYYSPIFDNSGYLYVCDESKNIYKISTNNGSIVESTNIGYHSSLVISKEGIIYAIGIDSSKYVIRAIDASDLSIKWNYTAPQTYYTTLSNDGILYFGTLGSELFAIKVDSTGLMDSPWPKYRKDLKNTGKAD